MGKRRVVLASAAVVILGFGIANGDASGGGDGDRVAAVGDGAPTTLASEREVATTVEAGAPPSTGAPSSTTPAKTAAPPSAIGVRSITDGDTFVLSDGRRVRLAQVDAPERNECFGAQATAALRSLIEGKQVTLRRPPIGPEKDRYGRTLADVLVAGTSVNEVLVATGAAEWYDEFADEDPDLARRLQSAEGAAKAARLGLWAACAASGTAASPVPAPPVTQALVAPTTSATTPPPSSDSQRTGNCHPAYPDDCIPPAPPDLDCPDIGHKVRVDLTYGDPHRLDADKDGWGCESYG